MPRFFFHFTSQNQIGRDDIGTEFPSLEDAYLDACRAVAEISFEKLRAHDDPTNDEIEIADEAGRTLMNIPFSEILMPHEKTNARTSRHATDRAIQACQRQTLRGRTLWSELQTEFAKAQDAFRSIQSKLAILNTEWRQGA
jgi:uncharacterized protein DUF6894